MPASGLTEIHGMATRDAGAAAGFSLALLRLRRTAPDQPRPYAVPLYPLVPIAFAGGSFYVLVASVRYVGWTGSLASFGMLALGLVVRALLRRGVEARA